MEKIYMRWSDGREFAVPFEVTSPGDLNAGLAEFRRHCDRNAELHVFVPHSAGGHWCTPKHLHHVMVQGSGADNLRVVAHETRVRRDGLISEAISVFSDTEAEEIIESARKTFWVWATGTDRDYSSYAMRDSLTVLRADLVANIRLASDDDLVPSPDEENNLDVLKTLARQYGLQRDFDRAYPAGRA